MRRLLNLTILPLIASLLFAAPFFSQTKTPTAESLKLREMKALEILRTTPHRVKLTIETRNSEAEEWQPYSCFITEYASARSYERRCTEPFRERIRIGKDTYAKTVDGSWKLERKASGRATVKPLSPAKTEVARLAADEAPESGAAGFSVESHSTYQSLVDGMVYDNDSTGDVWFDDQGRFVMREVIVFINLPRPGRFSRRAEIYEYDPDIKIEIPAIAKQ